MQVKDKYKGIIVPAVTLLNTTWQLDEAAVEILFESFYTHKISPFILGTTGEAASLPPELKKAYIKKAAGLKQAGTVLYSGISANCLEEAVELAKFSFDNGVDAVAATLPAYYPLTEYEMKCFFEELADNAGGPVIIYNIPATTHMSIPLKIIEELSYHPAIIATKDSERSDERLQQSLSLWKQRTDFAHFLGWAARSAIALQNGSAGLIPSTGNVAPEIYSTMWQAVAAGNVALAGRMQYYSDEAGNIYQAGKTLGQSLWALKTLMQHRGIGTAVVMPPLKGLGDAESKNLVEAWDKLMPVTT